MLERHVAASADGSAGKRAVEVNGGRTRTRTLDPLIKSQLAPLKYQRLVRKPVAISSITNQTVTHEMQTANRGLLLPARMATPLPGPRVLFCLEPPPLMAAVAQHELSRPLASTADGRIFDFMAATGDRL